MHRKCYFEIFSASQLGAAISGQGPTTVKNRARRPLQTRVVTGFKTKKSLERLVEYNSSSEIFL